VGRSGEGHASRPLRSALSPKRLERAEGQVNRLKTTEGVVYRRAGLDLLRQRVLHVALYESQAARYR
jgi:hypothetical protein